MQTTTTMKRISTTALAVLLSLAIVCAGSVPYAAAATSPSTAVSKVKSAYGSSYPLSSSNKITTAKKNVFGSYNKVLGVNLKNVKSYTAYKKSNSKYQYVCFVCKAKSKAKVSTIKKQLKKYVSSETSSNKNYYNAKGKKLMSKAKVGSKGTYCYLFILDTSGNSKAVKAFKKAV